MNVVHHDHEGMGNLQALTAVQGSMELLQHSLVAASLATLGFWQCHSCSSKAHPSATWLEEQGRVQPFTEVPESCMA